MRENSDKDGGAGDRFGDYLFDHCTNLPCISGCNKFTNTKLYALFSCICIVIFGQFLKDVVGDENVRKE